MRVKGKCNGRHGCVMEDVHVRANMQTGLRVTKQTRQIDQRQGKGGLKFVVRQLHGKLTTMKAEADWMGQRHL